MSTAIEQRKELFPFFRDNFDEPSLTIGEEIEIDDILPLLKEKKLRIGHLFCHMLAKASLAIPNFRLRIVNNALIEIKPQDLHVSLVMLNPFTDLNHCVVRYTDDFASFSEAMSKEEQHAVSSEKLIVPIGDKGNESAVINVSIMPWLKTNTLMSGGCPAIPLFSMGKFFSRGQGKLSFNLGANFHHGCVDAFHMYEFFDYVRQNLPCFAKQFVST